MIRSSTMSRVHSAIGRLLALAVELVAELPDQFALGPGQPFVVDGDGEHALFVPAVALDLLGAPTLAAEAAADGNASPSSDHLRQQGGVADDVDDAVAVARVVARAARASGRSCRA